MHVKEQEVSGMSSPLLHQSLWTLSPPNPLTHQHHEVQVSLLLWRGHMLTPVFVISFALVVLPHLCDYHIKRVHYMHVKEGKHAGYGIILVGRDSTTLLPASRLAPHPGTRVACWWR